MIILVADIFCLKASGKEVVKKILVVALYRSYEFVCIFQQWTPIFDP